MLFFACPLSPENTQNDTECGWYECGWYGQNLEMQWLVIVDMPHLLFHCHSYAVSDVSRGRHITLYGGIGYQTFDGDIYISYF